MAQRNWDAEYELLPREPSPVSARLLSALNNDYLSNSSSRIPSKSWYSWPNVLLLLSRFTSPVLYRRHSRYLFARRIRWIVAALPCIVLVAVLFTAVFLPSYTTLPQHYKILEKKCLESEKEGRGNVNNEKIFIAASLHDIRGHLLGGDWGEAVVQLVHLVGSSNVHLSVYQNDPDNWAKESLESLRHRLNCNISLVSEHLPLKSIPRVTIPSGELRIKRIAFLAEVRNRALRPLYNSPVKFDKLLFLNDIMFRPIDAVQLLFSTNINSNGQAQYGAACAVDFINAFKFYDRYATRDLEGNEMGVPFFPWFSDVGDSASRHDVLAQKDAVRVRACWGGMTAFEASWFQSQAKKALTNQASHDSPASISRFSPLRFRYEVDTFWDASECCLIHADLTYLRHGSNATTNTGIYTNPYIRVAYDSKTLSWLPYTRRVERLYAFVHNVVNRVAGLPNHNPRRLDQPGEKVADWVWKYDKSQNVQESSIAAHPPKGSYHLVNRTAEPGRFCGRQGLSVINGNAKQGEKQYVAVPLILPPG